MTAGRPTSWTPNQTLGFGAGSISGGHPGYASAALSGTSNLDMAEFPALGSQVPHHTNASTPSSANVFSTYASHAGTGVSNSAVMMPRSGAPFTPDEFPALNRAHAPQDSRNSNMPSAPSFGADHGSAWQHEAPRPSMAQELARKPGISAQASSSAVNQSSQGVSGWVPPSYDSQPPTGMNRIAVPRTGAAAASNEAVATPDAKVDASSMPAVSSDTAIPLPIYQVLSSPVDRFGLVGLVSLIKTQDPDMAMLTMGTNLQGFGMNLDSAEPLHTSFVTPWSQDPTIASMQVEPAYQLPSCYNVQTPPPAQTKIASFSDETLFFIFYSTPRDVLQEVAAQELYARNWRYHKGLHLWLTKEPNTEPLQKTPTYERGTYVFFDPGSWEKVSKSFVLMYEMLEDKPSSQGMMPATAVHPGTPSQLSAQAQATKAMNAAHVPPNVMPGSNAASPQTSFS